MADCVGLGTRMRALENTTLGGGGTFRLLVSDDDIQTDETSSPQEIISRTIPAGRWILLSAKIVCRAYGKFIITADDVKIGGGVTGPAESNVHFEEWLPSGIGYSAGTVIKVIYTQSYGPQMDISAFVGYSDIA